MKNREVQLLLGISAVATGVTGCSAMSQSDLLKMINNGDTIEIEIAVPENLKDTDENMLAWIILASLTTQQEMRTQWDDTLKITLAADGKNGCLYVDAEGNQENNNTLRVALHNRAFLTLLEDPNVVSALAQAADVAYTDIDSSENEEKALYAALNGYFNILPDSEDGASNIDDALTRREFMTMVARSELQVDENLRSSDEFNTAVGQSEFNVFAEQEAKYSYLDLGSKSLNNKTYNGVMSRGEAIYLIVNRFFADDLAKVGNLSAQFNDCKDGGNIAEKQKFIENGTAKDYYRDYELVYALQNPDDGCPSAIYNAMVIASNKGLVSKDTRWDEGITKYEATKLIVEALKKETGIEVFSYNNGGSAVDTTAVENVEANRVNGGGEDTDLTDFESDEEAEYYAQVHDEEEGTQEEVQDALDIETLTGIYYVQQNCNTRKGPSTDYEKAGGLTYKQEVQVTGRSKTTGWYEININGEKQYVSDKFLTTEKPQDKAATTNTTQPSNNTGNNSNTGSSGNTSNIIQSNDDGRVTMSNEEAQQIFGDSLTNLDDLEWGDFY